MLAAWRFDDLADLAPTGTRVRPNMVRGPVK